MSYSSIPTEPENAATAIGGRRYSSDTPTRVFYNEHIIFPNNDNTVSNPPSQLRRLSKIRRSSVEIKGQSIISKFSSKRKLVSPENENPEHIKIVLPLPSQLSEDFKNEQETFSTNITNSNSNKTVGEILEMPWIEENDKFSKKFWLVFVITLLVFFGFVIIGFGIYAYYTSYD